MSPEPRSATSGERQSELASLERQLGVTFHNREQLRDALTHPSFANEHPEQGATTNERLEFLGDAVLGLVVAEALYARFPEVQEGSLTEWRALLVCGPTLARVALEVLDLGPWLRLGRGEEQTGGREREGNLERAYEAIVGATYLDAGLEAARGLVERTLRDDFEALSQGTTDLNPKGALQQLGESGPGRPQYVLLATEGPDHARRYAVEVQVAGVALGRGEGATKQEAEKAAAREALPALRARLAADDGTSGAAAGEA